MKENLIMLRKLHGYAQEEIAERIGISRQAYGKWERGETIPDVEKCARLAAIYGVTLDSLVQKHALADETRLPPAPRGKHIFGTVTLSEDGQITLPKQARALFQWEAGCKLVLLGDEAEGLALVDEKTFRERMQRAVTLAAQTLPAEENGAGELKRDAT